MKRYLNIAMGYLIAALTAGVFYREFTRWNGFAGQTTLGKVHGHLLTLGMLLFLIVALFAERGNLSDQKFFRWFMICHAFGLILTTVMMIVRGVTQVLAMELSKGSDAAISGTAGIGHIFLGTGLILLLISLKRQAEKGPVR